MSLRVGREGGSGYSRGVVSSLHLGDALGGGRRSGGVCWYLLLDGGCHCDESARFLECGNLYGAVQSLVRGKGKDERLL